MIETSSEDRVIKMLPAMFFLQDSSLDLNPDANSRTAPGTMVALTNGSLSAKE
jgi:hypothetical protein